MRFRNRARRKKQRGSPVSATPAQPPPQISLATEIEQSVEARDRLEEAIPGFNTQREQAKRVFLRSLASDLRTAEIAPIPVRERLAAWKVEETRAAEQIDALQQTLTLFKENVEGFKKASRAEAAGAIQNIITRLTNERGKPGADQNAINSRIAKLSDELKPLQPTSPQAPPREPAEKEAPLERKSKGKSGGSEAAKK